MRWFRSLAREWADDIEHNINVWRHSTVTTQLEDGRIIEVTVKCTYDPKDKNNG